MTTSATTTSLRLHVIFARRAVGAESLIDGHLASARAFVEAVATGADIDALGIAFGPGDVSLQLVRSILLDEDDIVSELVGSRVPERLSLLDPSRSVVNDIARQIRGGAAQVSSRADALLGSVERSLQEPSRRG